MKSFKNYINEGIISGRGGAADKNVVIKLAVEKWIRENASRSKLSSIDIHDDKLYIKGKIKINSDIQSIIPPLPIEELDGDFECYDNQKIRSFEGAPRKVTGKFICHDCPNIESLNGSPEYAQTFDVSIYDDNLISKLTSLEGCPLWCEWYSFRGTNIENLKGSPKYVKESFKCNNCKNLKTLEGAPKYVGWVFDCSNCERLTSLKGAPKKAGFFRCTNCGVPFNEGYVESVCKVYQEIKV